MRRPTTTTWISSFGGFGRDRQRLPKAKRILVPVGASSMGEDALLLAGEIARSTKGTLFALYVIEVPRALPLDAPPEEELDRAEEVRAETESFYEHHHFHGVVEVLQARQTGPAIVNEALERQADLIIMGMRHYRRYGNFTLGAAVPYVLEHAPCAVWILREPVSQQDGL